MVKVLFLDDCINRHAKAFIHRGDKDLKQVWNADDCIKALKEETFAVVSLDHDLRGKAYDDPNIKNSGSEVVRWIVANNPDIQQVIIHSWNDQQAERLVRELKAAGYSASWEPFNL